jgi:maltooligosyltrehalose trehalohydrolase
MTVLQTKKGGPLSPGSLGASRLGGDDTGFLLWAPERKNIEIRITSGHEITVPMKNAGDGYFEAVVSGLGKDARYLFVLDGKMERPDPASHYQPEGVHGPSQIVRHEAFHWTDRKWRGIPLEDYIIYELHVGTFTPGGTFDAILPRIPYLKELGINAIELMPVSQFPGPRNWGYDGAYPYAVQNTYGGPEGLKSLVNECHAQGIAVILDVVYNHLGPEGNYLRDFGPYFTDRYRMPWGAAINFDGPLSDGVRRFFIENALHWFERYHIDALRIDAVHGIFDFSAKHILRELKEEVARRAAREVCLIAESDLNDVRLINPPELGGHGLDAQWNDDFHHSLHALLTGEQMGYYMDFGEPGHLSKALREGFVYAGQYSRFRKRRHGSPSAGRPARQFVVFSQNHDQVGNRMRSDRLASSLGVEQLKLAAAVVVLSPCVPLLFMGEEYGEKAPFQYFVSHSDPTLIEAVRKGRGEEFSHFGWEGEPPDPQAESAFNNSKINLELRHEGDSRVLFDFYKTLIMLKKELTPLKDPGRKNTEVVEYPDEKAMVVRLGHGRERVFWAANFNEAPVELSVPFEGGWRLLLNSLSDTGAGSADAFFDGTNASLRVGPYGFSLYGLEE